MSDPSLSDIDFKNKMAWVRTTLNCHHKMIFMIATKREKCAYMLLFLFRSTSWMFYSDVLLIVFVLNKLVWTGSIQLRSCHRPIAVLLSSQMWANWMITFRHPDTFLKTCRPIKTTFRPISPSDQTNRGQTKVGSEVESKIGRKIGINFTLKIRVLIGQFQKW